MGGRYHSGYWGVGYTVLAITQYDDWRGLSWLVRWDDGHTTEHSTAWNWQRDRVLSARDDIESIIGPVPQA